MLNNTQLNKIKTFIKENKRTVIIGSVLVALLIIALVIIFQEPPHPPIKYDTNAQDQLIELMDNKPTPTVDDALAKTKIISYLPSEQRSGVVHQEPNFRVEYLESGDIFTVEILSTEFEQVQEQANNWFIAQGMSQEGICKDAVQFFMNEQVKQMLKRAKGLVFNPLPPPCRKPASK